MIGITTCFIFIELNFSNGSLNDHPLLANLFGGSDRKRIETKKSSRFFGFYFSRSGICALSQGRLRFAAGGLRSRGYKFEDPTMFTVFGWWHARLVRAGPLAKFYDLII